MVHWHAEKKSILKRVKVADKRANENIVEGRIQRRQQQIDVLEASTTAEKL